MAAPNLSWTLNLERGTVSFGRLVPFAGNTYGLSLAGTAYGQTYTAYLMGEDGLTCLAKSACANSQYSIALNTSALRDEFTRDMHEVKTFHLVVRDTEKCVAEGDLPVAWNPLWEDTETGEVYTMRGPKGDPGNPGHQGVKGDPGKSAYQSAVENGFTGTVVEWLESLRGQPGFTTMIRSKDDGKWHPVSVTADEFGRPVLAIDEEGRDDNPDGSAYVSRVGAQSIAGVKTFTNTPNVPTVADGGGNADPTDSSTKAANTAWVTAKIAAWWNTIKAAAQSITGTWTFASLGASSLTAANATVTDTLAVKDGETDILTADADGVHVGGDATVDGDMEIGGGLAASGAVSHSGRETHSGAETHTGDETHSGAVSMGGELDATNVKDVSVGFSNDVQGKRNAANVKAVFGAVRLFAEYLGGNWVCFPGAKLPEGYNGSVEGTVKANLTNWREPGCASPCTADSPVSGLFGPAATEIEKYAAYSPNYLRRIFFPNVAKVGKYAFYDPDELEAIDLPECTEIGEYAFHGADRLTELRLPKCRHIGAGAFGGSFGSADDGTVDILIGGDAELGTGEETYNSIGDSAFADIPNGKIGKIVLPKTQIVGSDCFKDQRNVTEIGLPEAVRIGDRAFQWLNYGKSAPPYQFDLVLPKCTEIGDAAFSTRDSRYNLSSILSLTAPLLTAAKPYSFYRQTALASIDLPNALSIGAYAFGGCSALATVSIPNAQSIGASAFASCPALASISIPNAQSIGASAFASCPALASISIPNAQSIGASAFASSSTLNNVYIGGKTREEIKAMANFPWGRSTAVCRFHGSNGYVDGGGGFG